MSATLRVSDFAENTTLFPSPPPVINVSARQHPVTIHFSRRTSSDYVNEAVKKATKIHTRLPSGGILIFLTGQNEITGVCRKLEAKFGRKSLEEKRKRRTAAQQRTDIMGDHNNTSESQAVVHAQGGYELSSLQIMPDRPLADVEAEDVELGIVEHNELALDVDDGLSQEDPEGLDSDDDESAINDELGLDINETDSTYLSEHLLIVAIMDFCSSNACRPTIFSVTEREADVSVSTSAIWLSSSRCVNQRGRDISDNSRNSLCSRLWTGERSVSDYFIPSCCWTSSYALV